MGLRVLGLGGTTLDRVCNRIGVLGGLSLVPVRSSRYPRFLEMIVDLYLLR